MKILQVITSLKTGGAENLVSELVPLMNDENHQTDVLIFDGSDTPFKKKLENGGYRVITISKSKNVYDIKLIFRLIPIIKKYDIVHTHNSACQLFVAIAKVISRAKCKLVTTEHSTENRRREIKWFKPIDKWMYRQYDKIISISEIATDYLVKYIGNRYPVVTIPNGVNIAKFRNAEAHPEYRNADDVIITMVAAFRVGKDQDTIIRALTKLPENYKAWIIGDGIRRNEIESLISELNLNDRVNLWGVRTDVPQLLKSSDVIVMSSRYEGLSLSSIEGMSVGKPFIASDVKGLHETTVDAGILFPYQDVDALAKEIQHLMTDADYYKMIADRCMKRAEDFDISKTAEGYRRVYEELKKK
jgi:glycosyltransferase involved in cell wall biosynthesis